MKHLSLKFVLLLVLTLALVAGSARFSVQVQSSHAPILIDGDANFAPANGVTGGSGTALDPYIIEGWDINAATANGIEIRNTTAYFVIRNTTIHDGKPNNYQAISFQNVTCGIVMNVTSTNNVGLILMTGVSNSKVLNNTALDDGRIGLDSESHHNTIAFNYLWSPSRPYPEPASCIWLVGDYNDIIGNTLINFGNGISIDSNGDFNNIINNTVSNGQWYAINCDGNNTTVEGNEVSGGVRGITFRGFGNNITGNYAHDNSEGVYCGRYSSGVSIVGNIIVNNYYGISFGEEPASGELIYNNYLYNSINAYDIGTNNWNTSKTMGTSILGGPYLGGNYYSDYTGTDADGDGIGDTPYSIPGGSNIDYLPLVPYSPPPTPITVNVQAKVGSIHFRGETAEFYVLVSSQGNPIDANITATLYHNGAFYLDLSGLVAHVSLGLYWIPYTIPSNSPIGTYALVVEATYFANKGICLESFLLSSTLNGWNALLVSINGTLGTIKTDVGLIQVKLDAINATIVSINGTAVDIKTSLGILKSSIDDIQLKLIAINGTTVTIQTALGTMNGTIASVKDNIATIAIPDIGQIQTDISNLKGTQETWTIPIQYLITALALIAAAASTFSIIIIRRRRTS